jgi:hypothetical protein
MKGFLVLADQVLNMRLLVEKLHNSPFCLLLDILVELRQLDLHFLIYLMFLLVVHFLCFDFRLLEYPWCQSSSVLLSLKKRRLNVVVKPRMYQSDLVYNLDWQHLQVLLEISRQHCGKRQQFSDFSVH